MRNSMPATARQAICCPKLKEFIRFPDIAPAAFFRRFPMRLRGAPVP